MPHGTRTFALLLTVVACSTEKAPPIAAVATSASLPPLADDVDVDETVALARAGTAPPSLEITTVVRGNPEGTSRFVLGARTSDHPEREVRDLSAAGDDGAALSLESTEKGWTVRHAPGATVHLRYRLVPLEDVVSSDVHSYTRPIVQPARFQLLGLTSLLAPGWISPHDPQRVAFHWKGFREAKWTVASSFGLDAEGFRERRTWSELRSAVYLAGDLRILTREVHGHPLTVALMGHEWTFKDDALADLVASVASAERNLFQDFDWPFFLVSVVPVTPAREEARDFGGLALTQSLALFLAPSVPLSVDEDGAGLPVLVAHELFHQWNGRRYRVKKPEAATAWFVEGFSSFYARRILARIGAIDRAEYAASLNDSISRYLLRSVTPAADDEARAAYPYAKGDVIALLVDAEIQRRSKNKHSLDDVMRALVPRASPPLEVDSETVLAEVAKLTSPDFVTNVRMIIDEQKRAEIPTDLFAPCLVGHTETFGHFDLGFDWPGSRRAHHVVGLVAGSAAERAGLRDGDVITSADLRVGDARRAVTLHIVRDDSGGKRDVDASRLDHSSMTYLPDDASRNRVPLFAEGPEAAAKCVILL